MDTKEAQYGAGNRRPDDAEHDIHHEPHFTLHKLFCEPACNTADDDGRNPAYLRVVHGRPPQKGAPCTWIGLSNVQGPITRPGVSMSSTFYDAPPIGDKLMHGS